MEALNQDPLERIANPTDRANIQALIDGLPIDHVELRLRDGPTYGFTPRAPPRQPSSMDSDRVFSPLNKKET